MISISLFSIYKLITSSYQTKDYNNDIYIATKQISQYVLGTQYVDLGESYTYVDLEGREMTFKLDNHRLVKTPGFEILLTNIDNLAFENDNDMIYMTVERNEKNFRFLLTYAMQKDQETSKDEDEQ